MGKLARDSRAVRQEPLVHVDPVAQMRVLGEREHERTLLSAKVEVRATAPGL